MFRYDQKRLLVSKRRPILAYKVAQSDGDGPYYEGFARVRTHRWTPCQPKPPHLLSQRGWYAFANALEARQCAAEDDDRSLVQVQIAGIVIQGVELNGGRGYRAEFIRRVKS